MTAEEKTNHIVRGPKVSPLKLLAYGEHGVGITTFFSQAPGVLFVSLDGGANHMDVARWSGNLSDLDGLEGAIDHLTMYAKNLDVCTLAVEGVEQIEQLIIERIERKLVERAEETDGPTTFEEYNDEERGGGWDLVRSEWQKLLSRLDELQSRQPQMNVLISAAAMVTERRNAQDFLLHRNVPQIRGGQGCANLLKGWFDHILYISDEEIIETIDDVVVSCPRCKTIIPVPEGDFVDLFQLPRLEPPCSHAWCVKRETKRRVTGKSARFAHCTQTPWHDAKCHGGIEWPEQLVFDAEGGWERFATTARLIRKHGRALPMWLRAEGARAIGQMGPNGEMTASERQDNARKAFEVAIERRDYAFAKQIIDVADETKRLADVAETERGGQ